MPVPNLNFQTPRAVETGRNEILNQTAIGSSDGKRLSTILSDSIAVKDFGVTEGKIYCTLDPSQSERIRSLETDLGAASQDGMLFSLKETNLSNIKVIESSSSKELESFSNPGLSVVSSSSALALRRRSFSGPVSSFARTREPIRSGSASDEIAAKYGDIFKDKSLLFHGIGSDVTRIKSILTHGVLSENTAKKQGVTINRNYRGHNLNDTVSVAQSPAIHGTFEYAAFGLYIKSGISFILDGVYGFKAAHGSRRDSGFVDEVFIRNCAGPDKISGLVIPERYLSAEVSELSIGFGKGATACVIPRAKSVLSQLCSEHSYAPSEEEQAVFNATVDEVSDALTNQDASDSNGRARKSDSFNKLDKLVASHVAQAYRLEYGLDRVELRDILVRLLPDNFPIFSEKGYPLSLERA